MGLTSISIHLLIGLSVIGGPDYWTGILEWTTGTTFDPNFNVPHSAKFSSRIMFADVPDTMRWHRTSKIKLREMLEHGIILMLTESWIPDQR